MKVHSSNRNIEINKEGKYFVYVYQTSHMGKPLVAVSESKESAKFEIEEKIYLRKKYKNGKKYLHKRQGKTKSNPTK